MKSKIKELPPEKLRYFCNPNQFKFATTENLAPLKEVVGQERAVQAIDFGVNMKNYGYNIFVLGPVGAGRTSIIKEAIERRAQNLPTPLDWCYVYNFNDPDKPNAISLPAGKARVFKARMEHFIRELRKEVPAALNSEDFHKEQNQIIQKYQDKQNQILVEFDKKARNEGFVLQKGSMGFLLVPVVSGKPIMPDQFEKLGEEDKKRIEKRGKVLQEELNLIIQQIRGFEREVKQQIEKLERETVKFAIGHHIDELRTEFREYDEVVTYLNDAEEDLLNNIKDFKKTTEEDEKQVLLPMTHSFDRFRVNVIVDNRNTHGAPVVVETNPTYNNLIGRIDKRPQFGALVTDFTMIKGGSLHRANGGFLIVEADQVFRTQFAWEALKRALKNQEIKITDLSEEYSFVSAKTLEPETIPLNIKIILIGRSSLYYSLLNLDSEFRELFKVKADFNEHMKRNKDNVLKYAKFISTRCNEDNLLHFDREAVARVIEYGAELVGDQTRLSTKFSEICDLLREADYWARQRNHNAVKREDVQQALDAKKYRLNRVEELMQESIKEGRIFIDTSGEKVGQVNGLAIINWGDYFYGKPSRISVRTYYGKSGVIAIDREAKLSRPLHDKGVLILTGYLNGKFGRSKQLSISASITFEQSYSDIDGDSASSTELYGILSSLANIPIKQGIAVTGSVNQMGEIQPIGGVTAKIEGFFDICKHRGLTGEQGVIIPKVNVKNLMLKQEIIDAVADGKFHIYPVSTIDEGIEILTGVPAGKPKKDGTYPSDTVYGRVEKRLKELEEKSSRQDKENEEKKKK